MANRERGEVAMEIQGQVYTLVLSTNAMCEIEELLSTPSKPVTFPEVLERVNQNSVRHIRALIWGALRAHHPTLSLVDVGNLIQEAGGLLAFSVQLQALADSTKPDLEDAAEGKSGAERPRKARARKAGTGVISTFKPAASA